jgi:hypothetical protein
MTVNFIGIGKLSPGCVISTGSPGNIDRLARTGYARISRQDLLASNGKNKKRIKIKRALRLSTGLATGLSPKGCQPATAKTKSE